MTYSSMSASLFQRQMLPSGAELSWEPGVSVLQLPVQPRSLMGRHTPSPSFEKSLPRTLHSSSSFPKLKKEKNHPGSLLNTKFPV